MRPSSLLKMMTLNEMTFSSHGHRIRDLFSTAKESVAIIAPFIKIGALCSLTKVVDPDIHLRCVTRWLPEEVATGVTDPAIIYELQKRGNYSLTIVDSLHAKIYIADNRCLIGSVNTTNKGFGDVDNSNIEVLVESSVDDSSIKKTLSDVAQAEKVATIEMAEKIMMLATSLPQQDINVEEFWFPRSNKPDDAFKFYSNMPEPEEYLSEANRLLLLDLEATKIHPGLSEPKFRFEICSLLSEIPLVDALLDVTNDITLTRSDVHPQLKLLENEEFSVNDLWRSLVNWVVYFFPDQVMRQEISEVALRRARLIR